MATETRPLPVPYEQLRNIATEACDSALASVTSYDHSATESWNTSIINSILSKLVTETTPQSTTGGAAPQPQYKYVVNSTIIQHSPVPQSSDGAVGSGNSTPRTGRRGMHSASGAYWNNEKDGMWSFKYEAAEVRGLDVVVGIIWVWVG